VTWSSPFETLALGVEQPHRRHGLDEGSPQATARSGQGGAVGEEARLAEEDLDGEHSRYNLPKSVPGGIFTQSDPSDSSHSLQMKHTRDLDRFLLAFAH